jgi:uncharacterized phage protein gp47/JayE
MALFSDETPETIQARILGRADTELQTREGSYTYDMTAPVSFELWRVLMTLDELISAFYVDEYSGDYLDAHADLIGLARRVGTKAAAVMRFTGRSGVTIPAGTAFFSESGLEFDLVYDVTLSGGTGTGYVRAAAVGDEYNVEAGEIDQILRTIAGLESYTNDAATGGTDPESDAALFERIDEKRKYPATSGNEAHYRQWAMACNGVGECRVDRLWDGPGTVRVVIVGYDMDPVDDTVVTACAEYIETQRPVGAEVTVVSASGLAISVTATVTIGPEVALADVQAAFVSKLDTYLHSVVSAAFQALRSDKNAPKTCTVYYNRIAALLMDVDGVADYQDLLVNGGTETIVTDEISVPVLGEVTLS